MEKETVENFESEKTGQKKLEASPIRKLSNFFEKAKEEIKSRR